MALPVVNWFAARVPPTPTLIVVSGPPGTGKTTLAHTIARAVGCPAICRDEIKEGMVISSLGFEPGPRDELALRTLPTFFGVIEFLLRAGVTTVAEAAFQDRLWRPGLEPLRHLSEIRILHCTVAADVALERRIRRLHDDPTRRVHEAAVHHQDDVASTHARFARVSMPTPSMEVDTTDGYSPGLDTIVAFASRARVTVANAGP